MNKMWQVYAYELRRNIRRPGFLFATFGLPLIGFVLLLGNHAYQSMQNPEEMANPLAEFDFEGVERAGFVDFSGTFDAVPEALEEVLIPYAHETAARQALNAGEVDVFYEIAPDYLETGDVVLHLPNLQIPLITSGPMEQLFYATVGRELDVITILRLRNPITVVREFDLSEVESDGSTEASEGFEFGIVYAFTILFFIGLLMTNTYLMQSVIEERENRLIEILISTLRPTQLLTGKVLALGTLGLVQLVFWGVTMGVMALIAARLSTYETLLSSLTLSLRWELVPIMLIYFVLMYMTFAAVFGGIGAISGSSQEGQQYIGIMVLPTILPFYAFPLIQTEPQGALAVGLSLFPITSGVTMLMRTIVAIVPLWQLLLSIGIMVLTMVGAMWVAGRLFRVQTLLAGSFKLGDVPKLLFSDGTAPRRAKEV